VISTGVMRPFSCAVWALNALQNSMMLTPCWPSAGPTGGAGVRLPARDLQLDRCEDLLRHEFLRQSSFLT
jgi:hypothetical protein